MDALKQKKKTESLSKKVVLDNFKKFLKYYGLVCFFKGHKWEKKEDIPGKPYEDCTVCPCWRANNKIYSLRNDEEQFILVCVGLLYGLTMGGLFYLISHIVCLILGLK